METKELKTITIQLLKSTDDLATIRVSGCFTDGSPLILNSGILETFNLYNQDSLTINFDDGLKHALDNAPTDKTKLQ